MPLISSLRTGGTSFTHPSLWGLLLTWWSCFVFCSVCFFGYQAQQREPGLTPNARVSAGDTAGVFSGLASLVGIMAAMWGVHLATKLGRCRDADNTPELLDATAKGPEYVPPTTALNAQADVSPNPMASGQWPALQPSSGETEENVEGLTTTVITLSGGDGGNRRPGDNVVQRYG